MDGRKDKESKLRSWKVSPTKWEWTRSNYVKSQRVVLYLSIYARERKTNNVLN
jgi:hypothetical protein